MPFKDLLDKAMRKHRPSIAETGEELSIEYAIEWRVKAVNGAALLPLEQALRGDMLSGDDPEVFRKEDKNAAEQSYPHFHVSPSRVEDALDGIYDLVLGGKGRAHSDAILILNPDRSRISPFVRNEQMPPGVRQVPDGTDGQPLFDHLAYSYAYHMPGGAQVQSWISASRYVVIDVAAGPVEYGTSGASEGTVSRHSFPRLDVSTITSDFQDMPLKLLHRMSEFRAHLTSLAVSAVRHVFLPDLAYEKQHYAEKVLVPIVVLRNHNAFDPLHRVANFSIDIPLITSRIKELALPGQEIVVVSGVHLLHDHKPISMAVSRALRSDSELAMGRHGQYEAMDKPYLDSAQLFQELEDAADELAAGLMTAASPLHHRAFFNDDIPTAVDLDLEESSHKDMTIKQAQDELFGGLNADDQPVERKLIRSKGTRVLPVYVFSLLGYDPDLLIDRQHLVVNTHDAVLVLQTESMRVPLPYNVGGETVFASPQDPNRHILAGVANALAGILPPYQRYSRPAGKIVEDFVWAAGVHPFGPFVSEPRFSAASRDLVLRNAVVSRMHRALTAVRGSIADVEAFVADHMINPVGVHVINTPEDGWLDFLFERRPEHSPLGLETVRRLRTEISRLDKLFSAQSGNLMLHTIAKAYTQSSSLLLTTSAFTAYVRDEIEAVKNHMKCFTQAHELKSDRSLTTTIITLGTYLGVGIFAVLLVLWLVDRCAGRARVKRQ